jgi:hypothetical protein
VAAACGAAELRIFVDKINGKLKKTANDFFAWKKR